MGELHLDVILERIRREYGIAPRVGQPQVIRRETPKRTASATGIFDRELGKETHIGEVALSIAPRERGSGNQIRFAIDTAILPAAFVDACQAGRGKRAPVRSRYRLPPSGRGRRNHRHAPA